MSNLAVQVPTVLEILRKSTQYLDENASPSARLDAELLIAHALEVKRLDLYLQFDRQLRESELALIRQRLRRRANCEPVAYIVGEKEFYGRSFIISPDVLIPRPDTETLVEIVLQWVDNEQLQDQPIRVMDLGIGSGCIGISLAIELPHAKVMGVDISAPALQIAGQNIEHYHLNEKVKFKQGDWLSAFAENKTYDIVVGNLPYLTTVEIDNLDPGVKNFEPQQALDGGEDGMSAYQELLDSGARELRQTKLLALEVDAQRANMVADLLTLWEPNRQLTYHDDLTGRTRVICSAKQKI